MTNKKKPTKAATDNSTSTPDEDTQEMDRASAYQSDHFTVRFEGPSVLIAPVNWVGPAPLIVPESRLEELAELLTRANSK